ncbi:MULTISPECIES: hypothetical protein [unclassified Halomonas]|uniref:hypothetical protein n=1 Tax=unclassified Halomonas TaxID=2609666 RepID=UPI0021E3C1A9|nr:MULTISPECIES: hypothetical protein [unclassified Halomonas]UYG00960.1 hypothetical protein OCT39_05180 [Halomonas sp. GD1P12]WNL37978.1 hypothetical protein RN346_11815 [Halomonas sp. PAMB 3232]WNL41300.1 hypothetical protein RN347_11795 [Halomonas sp. PAMB 3264]
MTTVMILWVIAFVLIAYFAYKGWDNGVSEGLDKVLPAALKSRGESRYVWIIALAVLGATALINPVEILLVAILLALIGLAVVKLANWASGLSH